MNEVAMACLQGMAGNIIHAIATTNATIAGMIVVEAVKVLAGLPNMCKVCSSFSHQSAAFFKDP